MHLASRVVATGADFWLLSSQRTQLKSSVPVVSICAVRTGCGKSPLSRLVASELRREGWKPVVVRHPMPYGDLAAQAVQRFAGLDDLDKHLCTIEEREEYEPHLREGTVVYAGVDYGRILRQAEKEADIVLWDGGNNDTPFYASDLEIVVVDPHRPGHELAYYPGEVNLRRADVDRHQQGRHGRAPGYRNRAEQRPRQQPQGRSRRDGLPGRSLCSRNWSKDAKSSSSKMAPRSPMAKCLMAREWWPRGNAAPLNWSILDPTP